MYDISVTVDKNDECTVKEKIKTCSLKNLISCIPKRHSVLCAFLNNSQCYNQVGHLKLKKSIYYIKILIMLKTLVQ